VTPPITVVSGTPTFTGRDLEALAEQVAIAWTSAAEADWSVAAGTLEWTCTATADHAVDCVYAPAFFLASRRTDRYPEVGLDLTLASRATPALLVESLEIATRMLVSLVDSTPHDVRAILFQRPSAVTGTPRDFVPRAALELMLHAHDVCSGLAVPFEPARDLCIRLREHTRPWPVWSMWYGLDTTDDPWADLLRGSGRIRRP